VLTELLVLLVASSATPAPAPAAPGNPFDLNTIISGGTGATIIGALWYIGKSIFDRALPSRSDARASTQLVLEGLNSMVKVLQEDKIADSERLAAKQKRIDELESAADVDYDRIRELRDEILDLQTRLNQKDRHITTLVRELRRFGAQVTGLDLEDIEITHETRRIQQSIPELDEQDTTGPTPAR
jgi:chromosome segregation ATPase